MATLAPALVAAAAAVLFLLGCVHLAYTFFTTRLCPRDRGVQEQMERATVFLTPQTTVWRAWIGFNASHSLGAMLFGAVYGYLAWRQPAVLFDAPFLAGVGFAVLLAYLALAWRYWFRIPFGGIALANGLYAGGFLVRWLG